MLSEDSPSPPKAYFAKAELNSLIAALCEAGYEVIGPRVVDDAIQYLPLTSRDQLPYGIAEDQAPGKYRLVANAHDQYFQFNVGPHTWKRYLFPPRQRLTSATLDDDGWHFEEAKLPVEKYAFLGVRACELAAIAIQDRVFLQGSYVDPWYAARRESSLIIAINCTVSAETCFCVSMDTGPQCRLPYDLALTELDDGFLVEIGSTKGAQVVAGLDTRPATEAEFEQGDQLIQRATGQQSKQLDTTDLRNLLLNNLDHQHWDNVAERCLSCTNCTMVCPTCFCASVDEVTEWQGTQVDRVRQWDSCFNIDFSYTAGGIVRGDRRSRYRQWLTHKLASWIDQFDTSGCVGCGRCITWCPVGIDLTEEVQAIRTPPNRSRAHTQARQSPMSDTAQAEDTDAAE